MEGRGGSFLAAVRQRAEVRALRERRGVNAAIARASRLLRH